MIVSEMLDFMRKVVIVLNLIVIILSEGLEFNKKDVFLFKLIMKEIFGFFGGDVVLLKL